MMSFATIALAASTAVAVAHATSHRAAPATGDVWLSVEDAGQVRGSLPAPIACAGEHAAIADVRPCRAGLVGVAQSETASPQTPAFAAGRDGAAPGETLSENTWDFNAPYGVPGFAPMRPTDDVRAMVAGMHSGPSLLGDVTLAASVGSLGGSKAAETTAEADRSAGLYKWANWIFGAR